MFPMNNPAFALLNTMRNGGNPMQMMQQMSRQNPQVAQVMQMMQGKSPKQLQQIAQNMAKERGINLDEMMRQMGIFR